LSYEKIIYLFFGPKKSSPLDNGVDAFFYNFLMVKILFFPVVNKI
jgi:hypothetical protein